VGQKVKVLKGEYRGQDGILISAHDNTGVVRLDSSKKLINIEIASLASVPTSEGECL
jgi:transcription elongation factor